MKAVFFVCLLFFQCIDKDKFHTNKTTLESGTKIPSFSVSEINVVTPDGSQQKSFSDCEDVIW